MSSVLSTGICPHDIWSQTVFWKKRAKCRTGWSIARGASHYWHGCKATLTAPAFILLADQMGWSVSRWLTRAIRRVQIQLQVSKIYLVSYLSVINVSVWEALLRPAPPRPLPSPAAVTAEIPHDGAFLHQQDSGKGWTQIQFCWAGAHWGGVMGVIHTLQIHWNSVQVPHFYPPWQPEILTAAAQNDKINKNSWTVDQKMINWQFLFFGKFYLIYFINTGEKVQIDNGTPSFGFQVAAGRTHKKWGKLITILSFLISSFMWTFLSINLPNIFFLYLNNKSALEGSLSFLLIFKFCFV